MTFRFFPALLLFFCGSAQAQYIDFNDQAKEIYLDIMRLKIPVAKNKIAAAQKANPNNCAYLFLQDYIEMTEVFVSEKKTDLDRYNNGFNQRYNTIQKCSSDSPFKNFFLGELYLHSAIARIKFKQYSGAFFDINKANKLLKQNKAAFPEFYPNNKSLAVLKALLGTVPSKYQWGLKIMGLNCDIDKGIQELEQFISTSEHQDKLFYEEGIVFITFLKILLHNNPNEAYAITNSKMGDEQNLLFTFIKADIAYRKGFTDQAIYLLTNRAQSTDYIVLHYLEYMLGTYKLFRGDTDAKKYLKKYVTSFTGRNYIKDAYQKLAYIALLESNKTEYNGYIEKIKTTGDTFTDSDRKALKEAEINKKHNIHLLKARLFFDGSYYEESLSALNQLSLQSLNELEDKIEYNYRSGRVREALGYYQEAIRLYEETIAMSQGTSYYYGPKSCLQLGLMYEKNNQLTVSKKWFEKCLSYSDYDYQNGIEQQAKAGIQRITKQ